VRGPDGKRGIWPLEGGEFRPIPGLDSGYGIMGWTPDGGSLYVAPIRRGTLAAKSVKVSLANVQTGKMEPWKAFGKRRARESPLLARQSCRAMGALTLISTDGCCRRRMW